VSTGPVATSSPFTSITTVTTAPPSTAGSTSPDVVVDTGDVEGFGLGEVTIGDETLVVAVADESRLRQRGLMNVTDLGELDGMLFVMDEAVRSAFTMRNTLIPLHIAFFTDSGDLVDVLEMSPCDQEPCPSYRPRGSYRYAVEVPLGQFDDLDRSARMLVKG
jgi:uncharacterized protein